MNTINESAILHKDSPIEGYENDRFNRKVIVDNIVRTIKHECQKSHPCFTIGIYGQWGEGKTSVLNMIKSQIRDDENIVVSEFNPWLFKDQESLLLDFFNSIDGGKIDEQFAKGLTKYGWIASMGISGLVNLYAPGAGNVLHRSFSRFLDNLSRMDLSHGPVKRKEKLNEIITKSGKHLVVFIDDVDRLDKEEMHTLFKLIKQVADFSNTIFIVAMDVDMVSKSIGCRFEGGNEQAGRNFIDKIIQIPIHLPQIPENHLSDFLHVKIDRIFDIDSRNNPDVATQMEEAWGAIEEYIMPLMRTARDVIRYCNTLTFSVPVLYDEVNISDLCLLEATKIVAPNVYDKIRNNRHIIINSSFIYLDIFLSLSDKEEAERQYKSKKRKFVESVYEKGESSRAYAVQALVKHLLDGFVDSRGISNEDHKKRLISSRYFDKYFYYDVPKHIISDVEIKTLIEAIKIYDRIKLKDLLESFLKIYDNNELVRVLTMVFYRRDKDGITNDCIATLAVSLSLLDDNKLRMKYVEPRGLFRWEDIIIDVLKRITTIKEYDRVVTRRDNEIVINALRVIAYEAPAKFSLFVIAACEQSGVIYSKYVDDFNNLGAEAIESFVKVYGVKEFLSLGNYCVKLLLRIISGAYYDENEKWTEYENFATKLIKSPEGGISKVLGLFMDHNKLDYEGLVAFFPPQELLEQMKSEYRNNPTILEDEATNIFYGYHRDEIEQSDEKILLVEG